MDEAREFIEQNWEKFKEYLVTDRDISEDAADERAEEILGEMQGVLNIAYD